MEKKGDDAFVEKTDKYLGAHRPKNLIDARVSRDDNLYAYVADGDNIIEIADGKKTSLSIFIHQQEQTVLQITIDPDKCYVSDLDLFDMVKNAIQSAADVQVLHNLAAHYWRSVRSLKDFSVGDIRRPEIMIPHNVSPRKYNISKINESGLRSLQPHSIIMKCMKIILYSSIISLLLAVVIGIRAFAAKPTGGTSTKTPVGIDVSWPQCGRTLPTDQTFGIVGVNGGLANNSNPCFLEQLSWAQNSLGGANQPLASLYVNTANPGLLSASWPTSNEYKGVDPALSLTIENPHGTCTGAEDSACGYIYGWSRAYDDVHYREVPNPSTFKWWLDVETENSWSTSDLPSNAATLEGMTNYFTSIGATVGVYSTGYQWGTIVGTLDPASPLNGLDSWLAGARTLRGAKANCSDVPLTPTSTVTLTQYVSNNLDYNHSCAN